MKANKKLLKSITIALVIILDICLLNLNISINEYKVAIKPRSTANYIKLNTSQEYTKNINKPYISGVIQDEIFIEDKDVVEDVVYDNKTLNQLADQLNKSLNSNISGKGYLIASYSLEKSVDPYLATAIMLQETGCKWECSYLVKVCNNVGGQKGSGCGDYSAFNSLDEGIKAFIDNLYKNYTSFGLITAEQINPKYAEDANWSYNVNKYIEIIKAQ